MTGLRSATVASGLDIEYIPVDSSLGSGRPFRARAQLFPDGRCGIAVDGHPIWISRASVDISQRARVRIAGNSRDTKVLVGPLEVWTGIRDDVDWRAFEDSASRSAP